MHPVLLALLTLLVITSPLASGGQAPSAPAAASSPAVKFPTGYRAWRHSSTSAVVSDRHPLFHTFRGIHHVYRNEVALKAGQGKAYPEGSVIVLDLREWDEAEGGFTEGERKLVAVMQKDSVRFKATGGWGFEAFRAGDPKQRVVQDAATQCYSCHGSRKDSDGVFSRYRE